MIFDNQGITIYDISKYQSIIAIDNKPLPPEKQKHPDFKKMKADGNASAVIIKCGQWTYKDPCFTENWKNAKGILPRASYWFCDKRGDPKEQARLYWSFIKDDIGEGFLTADLENGSWTSYDSWYIFLSELQHLSGLPDNKIVIYSGYYFLMEHLPINPSQAKWFGKFPLWIASYTSNASWVKIPPIWEKAILWQDGTPAIGLSVGVWTKEIDHNYLNGGWQELNKYFDPIAEEDKRNKLFVSYNDKILKFEE